MLLEQVTDKNYRDFIALNKAVLVFSGDWCSDCKKFGPELERVITESDDLNLGVRFGKVDVKPQSQRPNDEICSLIMKRFPNVVGRVPRIEFYVDEYNVLAYSEAEATKENLKIDYLKQ